MPIYNNTRKNQPTVHQFPYLLLLPNMPTPLTDTRTDVLDFFSHSGNFRFSTSIENDTLTFSFVPMFTLSNTSSPSYSAYSPHSSYSPLQQESLAGQDTITVPGPSLVSVANSGAVFERGNETRPDDNADNDNDERGNFSAGTLDGHIGPSALFDSPHSTVFESQEEITQTPRRHTFYSLVLYSTTSLHLHILLPLPL
ncbi:hypothetical protein DEU56DRAFT_782526 [Suillus clintonianus]|uniref:uncharacterized protein n=1 Tax=Suillus clintonianus TaxID=1904413 RepID=UPI001B87E61F|nr:uncharacterized protein DEU56DRAFT_782526 [Suillus clintonianus]KAG2148854.1 hypothetical protein DEU56DRAFT_782526 [Suillus clintonianus]